MNRSSLSSRNGKPTKQQPTSGVNTLLSTLTHQPPAVAQPPKTASSRPTTASQQPQAPSQPREQIHQMTILQSQNTIKQAQQTLQNASQLSKPQQKQQMHQPPPSLQQEPVRQQVAAKQPAPPTKKQQQQQPPPPSRPQSSIPTKKQNLRSSFEPDQNEVLIECPEGCGRSFNEVALPKHAKICKKVFQQKRKQFNSANQRVVEEAKKVQVKGKKQQQQQQQQQQQIQKPQNAAKPKWKAQSEAFRAILRQNKGAALTKEESVSIAQMTTSDLVQCKFCGRKFNETAAKRHVQFCEKKSKENKIKQGPALKGTPVQPLPQQQKPTSALSANQKARR